MPSERRRDERRAPCGVSRVHVSAAVEQRRHDANSTAERGEDQRRRIRASLKEAVRFCAACDRCGNGSGVLRFARTRELLEERSRALLGHV